jgi:hypothetical protein
MKVKDSFLNLGQFHLDNGQNVRFGKINGWEISL